MSINRDSARQRPLLSQSMRYFAAQNSGKGACSTRESAASNDRRFAASILGSAGLSMSGGRDRRQELADTSSEIHRGAHYVVSRVTESGSQTKVLKTLRPGLDPTRLARAVDRLRHEHSMLVSLNAKGTPGVVRLLASEGAVRAPVLVLQDAGPETLADLLSYAPLGTTAFLDTAANLTQIVAAVHAQNVVHRNLTPKNVVVAANDVLTVIDFGLATHTTSFESGAVPPGQLTLQQLPYLAPEQTGRVDHPVDHRADLYALGAIFYEMLTGAPPFTSADPAELMHAHLARLPVPPNDKDAAIPRMLSAIVLRLLNKAPEQRYQAAEALLADLEEARRCWRATGTIPSFELGRLDIARGFAPITQLYGREVELQELEQSVARAREGARVLVLVRGPAGMGKSALIRALLARTGQLGEVVNAKFDLLRVEVPYGALTEGFRAYVRTLIRRPAAARELAKRRVREALGPNAGVVSGLIPELELLIGTPPPVPVVGPLATKNRFDFCFQAFIQALANAEAPLLLVLDDLQWADSASISLIEHLSTTAGSHHLLFLGAARSDEIDLAHPLRETLAAVERSPSKLRVLDLGPLDGAALTKFCASTLRCSPERAGSFAELLLRKTAGNPLFVERYLRYLHHSGLLTFDLAEGQWQWDLAQLSVSTVTDNVAGLMILAIARLPSETQALLRAAACFTGTIQLLALASVVDQPPDEVAARLWQVVTEGLLVPERAPEGSADAEDSSSSPILDSALADSGTHRPCYKFVHDRLRQAAYSLLSDEERTRVHRALGRELRRALSPRALEAHLFDVVDQLSLGAPAIELESERIELASLNLRAARRAVASASLGSGLAYARQGSALLPEEPWHAVPELWFDLQLEAVKCAYYGAHFETGERLFHAAIAQTASALKKAMLIELRMVALWNKRNDHEGALLLAREGLALLGQTLPATELEAALGAEIAIVVEARGAQSEDDLLNLPRMRDPALLLAMRILKELTPIAFYSGDSTLFAFVVARTIALSLVHGNADSSAFAYVCHGMLLDLALGDRASGDAFARVGLELARRSGSAEQESDTLSVFAGGWHHWRAPASACITLLKRAIALGVQSGDFPMVGSSSRTLNAISFFSGEDLLRIDAGCVEGLKLLDRIGQPSISPQLTDVRRAIRELQGRANDDEPAPSDELGTRIAHDVVSASTACLLRDFERARVHAAAAERLLRDAPSFRVSPNCAPLNFYASLSDLAYSVGASDEVKAELLAKVQARQLELGKWAEGCPENFSHKRTLVAAEVRRLEGACLHELLPMYDTAITEARGARVTQDEALANELAGRHCLSVACTGAGLFYLRAARETFARWGATEKARALDLEFPALLDAPVGGVESSLLASSEAFDLLSLSKASEILTSEVALDRLLEKLIPICLELAGAESGVLLLEDQGLMVVKAAGSVASPSESSMTARGREQAPSTLVAHVRRSGKALALADAARHAEFGHDPYIAQHGVKSALAVPIQRDGRSLGVIYLENNLAARVFTPERVRLFSLLSTQVGIALDNSRLFESLNAEVAVRLRAEQAMRFLADASVAMVESLDYRTTLAKVARLAVPFLADWCRVDLLQGDTGLVPVAAVHRDPSLEPVLRGFVEASPTLPASELPWAVALRSGQPVLIPEASQDFLLGAGRDLEVEAASRALGVRSIMVVPLCTTRGTIGAMTFVSGAPNRRYDSQDLELAQEVARRAAVSMENARLHSDLEVEQARLSAVFRHVPAGLVIAEAPTGRLLVANDQFEQILRREFRASSSVEDYNEYLGFHPGGERLRPEEWPLARSIRSGEIVHSEEYELERGDSSRASVSISSAPIRDPSGNITAGVAVLEDISERKLVEEQLRQSQKMEAIGQLASGLAHDFNNLLTAINGYSDLGLEYVDESARPHGFFLEILKAGKRAEGLTKQLLAYSRKQILESKVWRLNTIVEDMLPLLRRLIAEDIELTAVLEERVGTVRVDRGQVEQIILNLVVNARDAMPKGGQLKIETGSAWLDGTSTAAQLEAATGAHVILRVTDTGTGMDAGVRARIFDPFFTTKAVGKGTGLGLAVVYGILKQSGGSVSVQSELGEGTTFSVYLPEVEPDNGTQPSPSQVDEGKLSGTETILLVEDEELVRKFAAQALKSRGYTVLEATNGVDALELLASSEGRVQLVVADIVMPLMGGIAFAEQLRNTAQDLPVVFISGYAPREVEGDTDGRAILSKPFSTQELARKVRLLLDA